MQTGKSVFASFGKYREIIFAVVLFLIFDFGVLILNFAISSQIGQDAIGINMAGRQRMLSQRTVKTLLQINDAQRDDRGIAAPVQELSLTYNLFDTTLYGFSIGQVVAGGDGKPVRIAAVESVRAKAIVNEAIAIWEPYKQKLMPVLAASSAVDGERLQDAIAYATEHNLVLLGLMNNLTTELEQVAARRADTLRWVQAAAMVLALLNFFLILFHFLRKLSEREAAIKHYAQELESLVDIRTEELDVARVQLAEYTGSDAIDENELSRRRRAIQYGLDEFLSRTQTLEALCIWEDQFAGGSAFALFEFVHRIKRIPGVAAAKNRIHLALIRAMLLPLEKLGSDPWRDIQHYRQSGKVPETNTTHGRSEPVVARVIGKGRARK